MGLIPADALKTIATSSGDAWMNRAKSERRASYTPTHSSQGALEVRQLAAYSCMAPSTASLSAPCEQL